MDAMSVEILALLEAGRLLHDDLEITFIVIVRAWSTFHALEFGAYRVRRDQASVDPLARLGNLAVQHLCALKLRWALILRRDLPRIDQTSSWMLWSWHISLQRRVERHVLHTAAPGHILRIGIILTLRPVHRIHLLD